MELNRFTPDALTVLRNAVQQARALNQNLVGPEHLLLAIANLEASPASAALEVHVSPADLLVEVEHQVEVERRSGRRNLRHNIHRVEEENAPASISDLASAFTGLIPLISGDLLLTNSVSSLVVSEATAAVAKRFSKFLHGVAKDINDAFGK